MTHRGIITKLLHSTRYKPTRIKAYDLDGHSVTVECEGSPDLFQHSFAADAFCKQMGISGKFVVAWIGADTAAWVRTSPIYEIDMGL